MGDGIDDALSEKVGLNAPLPTFLLMAPLELEAILNTYSYTVGFRNI
jgi:hypothetical protein